jgi:subtilisin family serine protease
LHQPVPAARAARAALMLLACAFAGWLVVAPARAAGHASSIGLAPNDTFYPELMWPATSIGLPRAWALTLGKPSVTIAVLDTGVTPIPDLKGALVPGYNFVSGNTNTIDDNGHGTEVASIAAARTNNKIGIAGVCGRCSIMPVKVLDAKGVGSPATIALGVTWAVAHGAQIINLSMDSSQDNPVIDAAIAGAVAQGVTVVIAAGNAGSSDSAGTGYLGAGSADAIRVAGLTVGNTLFGWSNRGSAVDIAAPGMAAAAMSHGSFFLGLQGTSVAAPMVAGVAGLMLSSNPTMAPAMVKSLIESTGTPVAGLDVATGRRLNAFAAVLAASRKA